MRIEQLVWINEFLEKIQRKHLVEQYEIREIFSDKPKFRYLHKGNRKGENVYGVFGRTIEGRYLIVIFIYKMDKSALPISAREMTPAERKKYGTK